MKQDLIRPGVYDETRTIFDKIISRRNEMWKVILATTVLRKVARYAAKKEVGLLAGTALTVVAGKFIKKLSAKYPSLKNSKIPVSVH